MLRKPGRATAFTPTAWWSDVAQVWVPYQAEPLTDPAPTTYYERRRARLAAGYVEAIDRVVVFERDGGLCQICGEAVAKSRWPDPHSPTVDHIVALANGGLHAYTNVQLAHLICNQRKSAIPAGLTYMQGGT